MKLKFAALSSAVVVGAFASGGAMAAGPTVSEVLANSGVTANGWISGSYVYGTNDVGGGSESLLGHAFDAQTDSFQLNQAVVNLSALPKEGFGGLVTLLAGEDAQIINGAYGDGDNKFVVNQAFIQYASGALTVIGGRFNTLSGAEVIADPLNANLSRSLLFVNAEPLVHTGVRASYKVNDMFTGFLGVNNSTGGAADDGDRRKTLEAGGFITVSPTVSVGVYDYYGDESKTNTTNLLDAVVTWQVTSALQLVLNADYDTFDNDGAPDPEITGVAGYINYKISDLYRVSVRAETIEFDDDVNGTKNQRVNAYTLTGGYSPAKNFDLLVEGRIDDANEDIFVDGGDPDDQQPELAIKGIYKFGL